MSQQPKAPEEAKEPPKKGFLDRAIGSAKDAGKGVVNAAQKVVNIGQGTPTKLPTISYHPHAPNKHTKYRESLHERSLIESPPNPQRLY